MGFLNTDSMPRLVEKLADGDNIKITGNSKGNRVGTVVKKIVEKADDVTKAIEQEVVNDSYSFKVGTGDVDVSSDVEDGFSEVGLKGVTYQNLLLTPKDEFPISILKDLSHSLPILPPTKDITLIAKFSNIVEGARYRFWIGNKYYDESFSPIVRLKWNYSDVANATNVRFGCHQSSNQAILTELIILEGDHVDNPNIPNHFEGIVGIGDKSKNLFNPQKIADDLGLDVVSEGLVINKQIGNRLYIDSITPKPNTVYHISIQEYLPITTNETWSPIIGLEYTDGTNYESYTYTGLTTLTSSAKSVHRFYIRNPWPNVSGCWKNVHIVESIIATQYEPYYDGYKIEVSSKSKNLISKDIEWTWGDCSWGNGNSYPITTPGGRFHNINFIKVNPNTKYTTNFLMKGYTTPQSKLCGVLFYRKNGTYIGGLEPANNHGDGKPFVFTTPSDCRYLRLRGDLPADGDINNTIMLCLGEVTEFPHYEVYKEDKKQILLSEPLRGLPNGIKDTIEKVNGEWKIVRRCGEEALTNNTTIEEQGWSNQIITKTFAFTPSNFKGSWTSIVPICNTFITGTAGGTNGGYSNDIEGCFCDTGSIVFRIDRTKLVTEDVLGFKEWLSQNPTKVIYELGTPIIEDISPLTMQCWKNGTISINEVLPVESTHTVALNKPAQIKRNIEELTALRKRVQALEEQYDKIALEQAHQLSLINHSIELDYNI